MGTRNLTIVKLNDEYKVAQYGQWDGYPSGNGLIILEFLRNMPQNFKQKVDACQFIGDDEVKNRWKGCGADDSGFVNIDVADKFKALHPALSRDCGAKILSLIADSESGLEIQDDINFVNDSLFNDWTYLIDLDNNALEVYEGFNKAPLEPTARFYNAEIKDSEYYPIKLKAIFSFNNLPSDEQFLEICEPKEDDE